MVPITINDICSIHLLLIDYCPVVYISCMFSSTIYKNCIAIGTTRKRFVTATVGMGSCVGTEATIMRLLVYEIYKRELWRTRSVVY
jgi:hypothetical protein